MALLDRLATVFAFHAHESGIAFRTEGIGAEKAEGPRLQSNGAALERILFNLLENAMKYRRADDPHVELHLDVDAQHVRISIVDDGVGIARSELSHVFDEFWRARFEDYAVGGCGLGLAMARRLARNLGGDIEVASRVGHGSTFTLVLPRSDTRPSALPHEPVGAEP